MPTDVIKKAMLAGIGFALKTKDELEDIVKDYVKKEEMSEKEGKQFLDDLHNRYDEARQKLEEKIEKTVSRILKKADIATAKDIAGLKDEISKLKMRQKN